jgi:protein-glucosylgalactosylhydroxylysine glucosidase
VRVRLLAAPRASGSRIGRSCACASAAHWQSFWSDGGTLDLSGSADERASELERRVVLSEYLTAIQCAGTRPPQETGETFNSWFGKSHLEMHWWHAAHFPLWGRSPMLERSLPWYSLILPRARQIAARQGYLGARWPEMVGPDGRESPSGIGVFLIWQQPHPIYLAELVYRADAQRAVLERYKNIVFASAEFMASDPSWDQSTQRYVLGPPLVAHREQVPELAGGEAALHLEEARQGTPVVGDEEARRLACSKELGTRGPGGKGPGGRGSPGAPQPPISAMTCSRTSARRRGPLRDCTDLTGAR